METPEPELLRYWRGAGVGAQPAAGMQLLQLQGCRTRVVHRVGLLIARKRDSSHHPMFSGFIGAIQCRWKKNETLAGIEMSTFNLKGSTLNMA